MTTQDSKREIKKPKLKLPFTDQKSDMGEWAYDHRVGLCSMVIAYLLFAIIFVSSKIFVGAEQHTQGFYIDLSDVATLEEIRDELEEQVQAKEEFNWESVSNKASNENSLDKHVVDDRGTDAEALNNEAARAQEEIEANRRAYQEAINQIEEQREQGRKQDQEEASERRDIKRKGNVTVSYSFANPVRHAQELIIPAYQCQGGGEVVINAQLDRDGRVLKAEVRRGGDRCMQEAAIKAAKASRFNMVQDAPQLHSGTITYIFIPQ
ncbi:MAG: TonB family protein [Rikenellaceae bacterium]